MADRSIAAKRLKDDCQLFERLVRSNGQLPPELASYRPGQENNPEHGASGWYVYYGRLVAAHALLETPGSSPTKHAADLAGAETLSGTPLTRLSPVQNDASGPRYLTVYPKSFQTLAHLHGRDMTLARLQPTAGRLFDRPEFRPDVLRRVVDAIAEEHLLCVWVATHPGVAMPWEPESPPPPIPEFIQTMHPLEIHQVIEMNLTVNYRRLMMARPLLSPDPNPSGAQLYWSPFFVKAAELLGESSRVLMRDWSLESVLLSLQLIGSNQRDDAERAKQRRDDE